MADLTSNAFNLILSKLSDNPKKAADEYLTLHFKLEKYFEWQDRGRWQADHSALADETLDRVAKKLEEGIEIEKTVQSYSLGIARFVWLEYIRINPLPTEIENIPEPSAPESDPEEEDARLACLRSCLASVPKDDEERKLILDYYRKNGAKIKERRKALADKLGITTNALKVRMTRLREKLKNCIGKCMEKNL